MISFVLIAIAVGLAFEACCMETSQKEPPKKTFSLTVTSREGVDGYPQAGTCVCDKGSEVNYGYQTLEDFSDLAVTLDGASASATGSVAMNADHTLSSSCFKRVLWKYYVDTAVYYSCPAVGDDGTIYFGTGIYLGPPYNQWRPGTLSAMDRDGIVKWSYPTGTAFFSPVIGADGTVYIQDHLNNVYALTPSGGLKWVFHDYDFEIHRDMGQRNPAIGADGTIYISCDGLYAVHPVTCKRLWHLAHPTFPSRECLASPVVGRDGTIYDTIGEDMLFAVNPDGRQRWVFSFAHEWDMSFATPAIDQNGVVYLGVEGWDGAATSTVFAINPGGTQKWAYSVEGGRFVRASPAIGPDGTIYIATKAGGPELTAKLMALSPAGIKLWDYTVERVHTQTADDVYSTPSVGADGIIYFGAETGFFYALQPNGTPAWKQPLRYGINWSSPAILEDGTILIGTIAGDDYQGYLYAVKSTSQGYASTPWPRFRHDRKNTGRF